MSIMLEELYYYCGGYFGPNERLIVKKMASGFSLDYTKYYQDYVDNGVPHYHTLWSETHFMRWAKKLKAIGFDQWQDEYWIDACDGEQWELRYKYEGESIKKRQRKERRGTTMATHLYCKTISYSVSLNKLIERGPRVSGGPHFSCLNICLCVFYQMIDDDFSLFDFTAFQ